MTSEAMAAPGKVGRAAGLLRAGLAAVAETYHRGGRMYVVAPLIVAIAVLPEFAQHVVEMKLGMFESREAFRALSNDPLRWQFGYAKLTGLAIAIMATARYWRFGSVRAALLVRPRALLWIVLAVAVAAATGAGMEWLKAQAAGPAAAGIAVVSFLIQTLMQVVVIAALLEDRAMTAWRLVTWGWLIAAAQLALMGLAVLPAMGLHMGIHTLAVRTPVAIDWALMAADSLVVGLIAALFGSALYVGYFAGSRAARGRV